MMSLKRSRRSRNLRPFSPQDTRRNRPIFISISHHWLATCFPCCCFDYYDPKKESLEEIARKKTTAASATTTTTAAVPAAVAAKISSDVQVVTEAGTSSRSPQSSDSHGPSFQLPPTLPGLVLECHDKITENSSKRKMSVSNLMAQKVEEKESTEVKSGAEPKEVSEIQSGTEAVEHCDTKAGDCVEEQDSKKMKSEGETMTQSENNPFQLMIEAVQEDKRILSVSNKEMQILEATGKRKNDDQSKDFQATHQEAVSCEKLIQKTSSGEKLTQPASNSQSSSNNRKQVRELVPDNGSAGGDLAKDSVGNNSKEEEEVVGKLHKEKESEGNESKNNAQDVRRVPNYEATKVSKKKKASTLTVLEKLAEAEKKLAANSEEIKRKRQKYRRMIAEEKSNLKKLEKEIQHFLVDISAASSEIKQLKEQKRGKGSLNADIDVDIAVSKLKMKKLKDKLSMLNSLRDNTCNKIKKYQNKIDYHLHILHEYDDEPHTSKKKGAVPKCAPSCFISNRPVKSGTVKALTSKAKQPLSGSAPPNENEGKYPELVKEQFTLCPPTQSPRVTDKPHLHNKDMVIVDLEDEDFVFS